MSRLGILCHTFAVISATILYSLYTIRLLVEVHIRDFGNVYSDHSAEESSRINLDPWRTIPISLRIFFSFLVTFFGEL